mmetsp:Transcript_50667/g.100232  ORF Transcript_50667/g.100232 Transcript_50667/m.100232 type:complete len:252 (-) Transcript_50667:1492-2247(-)
MSTGRFACKGASLKCWSIARAPSRTFSTTGKPYLRLSGTKPAEEHTEYLPPTQSQKRKNLSSLTPNAATFSRAESDAQATTCAAVMALASAALKSPPSLSVGVSMRSQSHWRMVRAFSIVSAVVKVLLTTTTSVSSGSRPDTARSTSTGSTLDRNLKVKPWLLKSPSPSVASTSDTNSGPKYDPPMPTLITFLIGRPVKPRITPSSASSSSSSSVPSSVPSSPSLPSERRRPVSSLLKRLLPSVFWSPPPE